MHPRVSSEDVWGLSSLAGPSSEGSSRALLRRVLIWEILIVLALSLGKSGVYAVVNLLDKATRAPLGSQTTSLNNSLNSREIFDLTYQILDIFFTLVPVVLVLFLLFMSLRVSPFRLLGFDFAHWKLDLLWGFLLFLTMGLGTLGVYAAGRALGVTTAIVPSALDEYWWTVPVLLLSAGRHAVLEEVVIVGWFFDRLRRLAWGPVAVILVSALVRGSYHLYQGIGPFVGNFAMGLVFGAFYLKYRRVMPLVYAHFLLDAVGFVGFALLGPAIGFGT
ncbi:hypothetical protein HD598_000189 [Neomicrococcus aestuarii]|uniref:CAAX prenyl protease 2/Lysostaphin resistance protein A-like domain-containing protein n=1 Tax=Neomicrococcus aestuarii TaxID=556325 RepID=A0A7W8TRC7_9MICC|nr:CPBP family intramembrane glutamic endopeptidase [Neomicrococcus aestuarii]MBB5511502.1 hypothetical protein [Neomicrococcus aestuarii]